MSQKHNSAPRVAFPASLYNTTSLTMGRKMLFDKPDDGGKPTAKSVDDILSAIGDVKKTYSEHRNAFEEFKTKNDERLDELKKGYDDVVRKEELDRINETLNKQQEAFEALGARMKRISLYGRNADEGASPEELDAKARQWAKVNAKARGEVVPDNFGYADAQEYKEAFYNFIRHRGDEKTMSPEQLKALSVGSDPDGGYVVDPDTSGRVVSLIYETSPIRQYASVQTIGTDALEGLHDNDEASSGWVGETEARAETNTPQLEKWRIPVHEQYAAPKATQKLLDDAAVNMEMWLSGKVSDKFARTENTAFVVGDGVGKPRGFATYADWTTAGTFELGAIEQFNTGVNGDFAAAPAGGDVLIDALMALKMQYRNNATWFMNRATVSGVRQLKDSNGAYLWQPGISAGQPASLLGYPQASFEDMADYTTTGALAIAVGDMRAAYQIVDRIGIRVLRDPYTSKPYVIFYSTKRVGGDVLDFDALKIVNFTA